MRKLFGIFKIAWQVNNVKTVLYNFSPRRGARFQENLKWVKPAEKPFYDPIRSGDLDVMPKLNQDSVYFEFSESKSLQNAEEKVKKIFSLKYQIHKKNLLTYQKELVDKVKNHDLDTNSLEVRIAELTGKIRYHSEIISMRPAIYGKKRVELSNNIQKRAKLLSLLRLADYKKFEWVLEALNVVYKPIPLNNNRPTRKKSLIMLAKLRVEQSKEEKLAEQKKSLDEQKILFLENKINKLKDIKEKEEKYNLPVTVTDKDIEECMENLEKLKVEISEKIKRGYRRKIHPFYLVPYDEALLEEKEKTGSLIREEIMKSKQKEIAISQN